MLPKHFTDSLLGMYHQLREAQSTSDFPLLLGNVMHKELLNVFRMPISPWRRLVKRGRLQDFKTHDRIIMSEAPDLVKVAQKGPYKGSNLDEDRYQLQLETYGRLWQISRQAVINDDLDALLQFPSRYGRAASRTLAKQVVHVVEANEVAYDGNVLFGTRNSISNDGHTELTANEAGITTLSTAKAAIRKQTDRATGERIGFGALNRFLLWVPPDKEDIALRLANMTQFVSGGGTSTVPVDNPHAGTLDVLVDPFLTFTTRCYLLVPPEEAPFAEVGFLNGVEEPAILVKRAEAVSVAGGAEDPWGYAFDDLEYKIRHDWATKAAYYQAIYKIGD